MDAKHEIITLANECGIDTDSDGDIFGSTNGALLVFAARLIQHVKIAVEQMQADALTSQQSRIAALELQVSGERGQKEIWETRAKEWCESSTALIEDNDSLRKSLNGESEARCALEDEVKALRKDAERYRWLKSRTRCFSLDMGGRHRYDPSSAFMRLQGPTLDDAFDAAIAKDKAALSAASDGGK